MKTDWHWGISKKALVVVLSVLGLAAATETAAARELAHFPIDGTVSPDGQVPDTVSVSFAADNSSDGNGAIRLTSSGTAAVFVPLFVVEHPLTEPKGLTYTAAIRAEGLQGTACVEMRYIAGEAESFSRALDQPVTGTCEWKEASTPFYVRKEDPLPDKVILGVCIEGPGDVWVDAARLSEGATGGSASLWTWIWGPVLGILGAIYGTLAGVFVPRGQARNVILGLAWVAIGLSVILLLVGLGALVSGSAYTVWYPLVLTGFIGAAVFGGLMPVVKRQYQQAEMRRMKAMDLRK